MTRPRIVTTWPVRGLVAPLPWIAAMPVTVAAGQAAALDFALRTQAVTLNTVVTVGYTNQERRDISGAVSSVTD
ncbi:MAG TPA: hypothetical protein VD886_09660, partial [Herpetosiphonaceae bacterium]|nr:hypothetical protein [Herpetosiphonaceae bacterium]